MSWMNEGLRYFRYSYFLKKKFGKNVYRVSLDAGLSCPNKDGTTSHEGCIFCDNDSFTPAAKHREFSIKEQIERQLNKLVRRYGVESFLAYFQAGTNTHGSIDMLRRMYSEAVDHPNIVGLIIGTRPDCLSDECLDLIGDYARKTFVSLEIGLQSIHEKSLRWMNRGHHASTFFDAVRRSKDHAIDVTAHVILGLPGETVEDMIATAKALSDSAVDGVKIHNLHVVRNTKLEEKYNLGEISVPEKEEYVGMLIHFLEHLHPRIVIQRLLSDIPRRYLVAPEWTHHKDAFLAELDQELERRDIRQGRMIQPLTYQTKEA